MSVPVTLSFISPINIRNYDSKTPTLSTASQCLSSFQDRPTIEAMERSPSHSILFNTCSGVWHLSLAFLSPLNMTCKSIGETPLLQRAGTTLTHPGTHSLFMEQTSLPPKPALLSNPGMAFEAPQFCACSRLRGGQMICSLLNKVLVVGLCGVGPWRLLSHYKHAQSVGGNVT